MKKETKKQRAERKAMFMAKATAHGDSKKIRKEASDLFEKKNPKK
jgi:hypothetical protein